MFHSHIDKAFPFGMGFGRGRGFGRERLLRGHLNMIILEIIKERPRHGYDVIKAIEEKFHGFYSPSAGSVYPILQELEDHDGTPSAAPLARASGLVIGWYRRGAEELESKLRKHWKQFRTDQRFWTEDAAG